MVTISGVTDSNAIQLNGVWTVTLSYSDKFYIFACGRCRSPAPVDGTYNSGSIRAIASVHSAISRLQNGGIITFSDLAGFHRSIIYHGL